MARSKPAKTLKISVPRHNAQRIGPSLTAEIHSLARQESILVQLPPPVQEQPSSAGPSAENASEWNSLLITARAGRGPFWDIGTQQFLVEKESELYYNPTPLLEAARSLSKAESNNSQSNNDSRQQQASNNSMMNQTIHLPQQHQQQRGGNVYPSAGPNYPYPNTAGGPMTPQRNANYPGTPGGAAGGGYFGDVVTPARQGMIDGIGGTPDVYGRRITRGMSEGYQNFGS